MKVTFHHGSRLLFCFCRRLADLDQNRFLVGPASLVGIIFLVGTLGAADKSGVSPNTISVPKGPGSIEGLGEAFQPTLNTGTAKYNICLLYTSPSPRDS